jgi:aryl-alcohol dehydrogenase-like predicted oxidoreductase
LFPQPRPLENASFAPFRWSCAKNQSDNGKTYAGIGNDCHRSTLNGSWTNLWPTPGGAFRAVSSRDVSPHELALSWLAVQPLVASIIAGSSNSDQLESKFKAATRGLTAADKAEVDRIVGA